MGSKAEPELHFLPLGGSNEIGMNLNLFAYGDQWLMVDLGITFGDDTTPSLDIIMPDIRFIEGKRDKLLGLVLTHGHEDHIGAVPYLWSRLKCPVYATPFTASLVRRKLADANLLDKVELHEVPLSGDMEIGPFKIDLVRLTHSIPEPNGLAITTPVGVIYHTGDWKFDPEPVIGAPPDYARLSDLGDNGVLALIGDSTNVFVNGETASESNLYADLSA
ncbi:MAG: ribonuclease J, partial [Rhodospirillaceae bacterium]